MLNTKIGRRRFLRCAALAAAGGCSLLRAADPPKPQRVTLAQFELSSDLQRNLDNARKAFDAARRDRSQWVLFPEMFLTGAQANFDQAAVTAALAELAGLCRKAHVFALVGTGWKEGGKVLIQVRAIDFEGRPAGVATKNCLCTSEESWATAGPAPSVMDFAGIKAGILIGNDFWVTPGFSENPDPRWSLRLARAGAQVIFHHINSGNDQRYRTFHEANHGARAAEARCPVVSVNSFTRPASNACSGVAGTNFRYLAALPRDAETVQTVSFVPAPGK